MAHFRKYHGLGNDYLVIDPQDFPFVPTPEAVRMVCDRHYGIGADGILLGPMLHGNLPVLRIFNSDGSEAEKSGNGLRIFSWYLHERGHVFEQEFSLLTKGGLVRSTIVDFGEKRVRVDMGAPSFALGPFGSVLDQEYAFAGELCRISCVSMGNPHCVVLGKAISESLARRLGPLIEHAPLFPAGTNVQFLEVLNASEIRIEIWERGSGYTLASGSSSCAASAVARRLGFTGDEVIVHMPGGRLEVSFREGTAFLTGSVAKVFEGTFSAEIMARIWSAKE